MDDRSRSTTRTAVLCGFLLLAFAVFAWGLHAKLSLYHSGVVPSNANVAKLLVKQNPGPALATPEDYPTQPTSFDLAFVALTALILLPLLQTRRLSASPPRSWIDLAAYAPPVSSRPPPAFSCAR